MNWDAVQAVTEVVGLIVVVASVIYIAIQTRQTNDHATASSEIEWFNAWNNILNNWVSDQITNDIVRRGFDGFDDLDKAAQSVFHMRIAAMVNHWILAKTLNAKGLLSDELIVGATKVVIAILTTPGGYQYLKHDWKLYPGGAEILRMVEESRGKVPCLTDVQPWWSAKD